MTSDVNPSNHAKPPRKRLKGEAVTIDEMPWHYQQALREMYPPDPSGLGAWFNRIARERLNGR